MKKFLTALCLSLTAAATAAAVAACDGDGQEQAHTHDMTYVTAVEATCTEEGNTAYYKCDGCGKYYSDQEGKNEITLSSTVVAAKGHTPETVPGKEATCTQAGLTEGKKCSVCGAVIEAQEEIAAKGHTPATAVKEDEVAATCTSEGSYDEVVYCSVCGAEISREHKTVGKTAHDLEPVAAVPATCTANGTIAYYKCKDCGAMFSDEAGETAITAEDVVDPAKGHTPETIPGKEATCKETGLTQGEKCSVCGEILTAQIVIPVKAHTPETIPGKAATCTEDGLTDGEKCSVCGTVLKEGQKIPALKHDYTDVTPEWEWEGYESATATFVCTRENCGHPEVVEATVESKVTVGATCEKEGEKTYTATVTFGDKQYTDTKVEKLAKAAHTPAAAVKENEVAATCTSEGSYDEVVYCSACGAEISREHKTVGKTAHDLELIAANPATCTANGTIAYYKCKYCGAMFSDETGETAITAEDIVEPAKGHTYASVSVTIAPTAEAEGSASVTCANCDYSGEIALPALTDENVENGTYHYSVSYRYVGNSTVVYFYKDKQYELADNKYDVPAFVVESTATSERIQSPNSMMIDVSSLPASVTFSSRYLSGNTSMDAARYGVYIKNAVAGTYKLALPADLDLIVTLIGSDGTVTDLITTAGQTEAKFELAEGVHYMLVPHSAVTRVNTTLTIEESKEIVISPSQTVEIGSFGGSAGSGSDVQGDVVTVKVAEDTPAGTYKLKLSGYGGITRMYFTFTVNGVDYKTAIDMVGGMGVSVTVELKGGDEFTITSNNIEDAPNLKLTMTAV